MNNLYFWCFGNNMLSSSKGLAKGYRKENANITYGIDIQLIKPLPFFPSMLWESTNVVPRLDF